MCTHPNTMIVKYTTLFATAGAVVGVTLSTIFNDLDQFSLHIENAAICALYFAGLGVLVGIAVRQRRRRRETDLERPVEESVN